MTRSWLLIAALGLAACHQAVTFQGEQSASGPGNEPFAQMRRARCATTRSATSLRAACAHAIELVR